MGPYQTEQIYDPEFESLVAALCLRPGMYVSPPSFVAVCSFIGGFDAARSGGPLIGIHPWLVLRGDGGNNLVWWALAETLLGPKGPVGEGSSESEKILALGRLLCEFFEHRRTNGLTKIFNDYARWLLRTSWYDGPLRRSEPSNG